LKTFSWTLADRRADIERTAAMNSHGGTQEEFRLKWNDHHNSFFTIMQDLFTTEMLTDVTLACGGEVFETHKLMLCVCSTFFRQILTRRPDKHPIVFLKDVNPRHLVSVFIKNSFLLFVIFALSQN